MLYRYIILFLFLKICNNWFLPFNEEFLIALTVLLFFFILYYVFSTSLHKILFFYIYNIFFIFQFAIEVSLRFLERSIRFFF